MLPIRGFLSNLDKKQIKATLIFTHSPTFVIGPQDHCGKKIKVAQNLLKYIWFQNF